MNPELFDVLVCPETRQALHLAEPGFIDDLNRRIAEGSVHNRSGQMVKEKLDGGLIRADGRFLYPLRQDIPVMLIEEAIPLFLFLIESAVVNLPPAL